MMYVRSLFDVCAQANDVCAVSVRCMCASKLCMCRLCSLVFVRFVPLGTYVRRAWRCHRERYRRATHRPLRVREQVGPSSGHQVPQSLRSWLEVPTKSADLKLLPAATRNLGGLPEARNRNCAVAPRALADRSGARAQARARADVQHPREARHCHP